jgi:hypothetical protein
MDFMNYTRHSVIPKTQSHKWYIMKTRPETNTKSEKHTEGSVVGW